MLGQTHTTTTDTIHTAAARMAEQTVRTPPRPRLFPRSSTPLLLLLLGLVACSLLLVVTPAAAATAPQDLYCGMHDCYAILGVEQAATPSQVKKAFYKLSLEWHPDKTKHPVEEAKERYREITTAYEVLSDAEARAGYDEALLHPERLWANRLRYMQFKAAKQTDARFILSFTLLLASVLHWLYWGHRYEKVRELIALNPAVQTRMKNKVKADLIAEKIAAGDKKPAPTKDEIDARLSLEDVSSYAELTSWEGRRPTWIDALPVWLALAPFRFARGLLWHARYQLQYTLMGREYPEGSLDASYATAMALGMSYNKWLTVDEPKRAELVARKLWEPKLMEAWRRESVAAKKKTW